MLASDFFDSLRKTAITPLPACTNGRAHPTQIADEHALDRHGRRSLIEEGAGLKRSGRMGLKVVDRCYKSTVLRLYQPPLKNLRGIGRQYPMWIIKASPLRNVSSETAAVLNSPPGARERSKGIRSVSYKTPTCTRPGVGPGIDFCPLHVAGNFTENRKAIPGAAVGHQKTCIFRAARVEGLSRNGAVLRIQ